VFQTGDLLTTQHSNLPLIKTLITGLVSQKDIGKCSVYVDVFSKFLKLCLNYYMESLDLIIVPLDFLLMLASRIDTSKVFKLCQKFVLLVKQVIYEVSIQQATHIAAYSIATQG
jgi:hypothetical protein